jgi:hypothetical protein
MLKERRTTAGVGLSPGRDDLLDEREEHSDALGSFPPSYWNIHTHTHREREREREKERRGLWKGDL